MDPERWARVKELFHAALECEPERRRAFLAETTGDDESLRLAVEAMLARRPDADRFLEVPAVEAAAMAIAAELGQPGSAGAEPESRPAAVSSPPALRPARHRRPALPPWWMLLLAAIFLGDGAVRTWCYLAGPEGFGFTSALRSGRHVVTEVAAGGAAERAGFRPGDVIIARDGLPAEQAQNRWITRPNFEVGRTYRFEIARDGHPHSLSIPMRRSIVFGGPDSRSPEREAVAVGDELALILWQITMWAMLATGLLIAFARPRDGNARAGGLTLAVLGMSFYLLNLPPGYATAWRGIPWGLGAFFVLPHAATALVGPIGLSFFLLFPRPLVRRAWIWALVWLPALPAAFDHLRVTLFIVYWPEQASIQNVVTSASNQLQVRVFAGYGLAMLAAITASYFSLTDPNEKRRLRVLVVGGAAGAFPGLARMTVWAVAPTSALREYLLYGWPDVPIAAGFLLFPASFAYAVLRHRVLGVRVIVRMGVQYALARGLILSLVPILGLILVADALLHGSRPLIEIVRARGWIYAALAGFAVVVHTQRHRMAAAIDRRFFREQYDARHLLRDVAEQARRAGSLEPAAPAVVSRVEAALQPTFAALLVRSSGMTFFRTVAVAPAGARPPLLREDDAIVTALRSTEKPVQTSGWYNLREEERRLGDRDASFTVQGSATPGGGKAEPVAPIELAVPIVMSVERDEALLAFGPRRSEEPYTQEDIDSVAAIAASLALFAAQPPGDASRLGSAFEECPRCGTCYDQGAGRCTRGGEVLLAVGMPRTLAERYRLERRLGRGGMGKVYEATDTALGRRVAVKVIREEWVHSAVAIERFRREARAVAGFDHPNVVTVYDYGVETGRRAFIVMELLRGSTLGDELRRAGRLGPARTLEIFREVCSVVEAAHRRRIVHPDLKPDNVFLLRPGRGAGVKVLDFGVAKVLAGPAAQAEPGFATQTAIGVMVGTIGYMPPEQLLGDPPDVSWDIWALGVVAYECLAGTLPFPVTSWDAWRHLVLAGRPVPLAEHVPDAPATWQTFFDRCLAADRTGRPGSAAEFLRELERALGGRAATLAR